jgi:heme O synthase-like polyprenyltransferase
MAFFSGALISGLSFAYTMLLGWCNSKYLLAFSLVCIGFLVVAWSVPHYQAAIGNIEEIVRYRQFVGGG